MLDLGVKVLGNLVSDDSIDIDNLGTGLMVATSIRATGTPGANSYGTLLHLCGGIYAAQMFFGDDYQRTFVRHRSNNMVWTAWKEIVETAI